jgi:hypothetical protein
MAIRPVLNELQEKVYAYLKQCGARGATDEEMQGALGMNPSTQRPRRIELMREFDAVFSAGRTRPGKSGVGATVWVVIQFAPSELIEPQLVANAEARKLEDEKKAARKAERAAKASAIPPPGAHRPAVAVPAPATPAPVLVPPPRPALADPFDLSARAPAPRPDRPISREQFEALKASLRRTAPVRDPFDLSR